MGERVIELQLELKNRPVRSMTFGDGKISVGRSPNCRVSIDNPGISWEHCIIDRRDNGEYFVVDLQSANGTYLNDKRVKRVRIRTGDTIRVGKFKLLVTVRQSSEGELLLDADDGTQKVVLPAEHTVALSKADMDRLKLDLAPRQSGEATVAGDFPPSSAPSRSRPPYGGYASAGQQFVPSTQRFARGAQPEPFWSTPSWHLVFLAAVFGTLFGFILGIWAH